jgi:hypothetical protein
MIGADVRDRGSGETVELDIVCIGGMLRLPGVGVDFVVAISVGAIFSRSRVVVPRITDRDANLAWIRMS